MQTLTCWVLSTRFINGILICAEYLYFAQGHVLQAFVRAYDLNMHVPCGLDIKAYLRHQYHGPFKFKWKLVFTLQSYGVRKGNCTLESSTFQGCEIGVRVDPREESHFICLVYFSISRRYLGLYSEWWLLLLCYGYSLLFSPLRVCVAWLEVHLQSRFGLGFLPSLQAFHLV